MKFVAVTACTVGVAHTFMAAEVLEKEAKKLGYEIKVETQGANGIQNRLTQEEIDSADACIFAVDTAVSEPERFDNAVVLECKVKDAIKKPKKIFEKLEKALQANS